MNPQFTRRERCPCCVSGAVETIYACPFSEAPVAGFLLRYYGPHLCERDLLDMAGADYALIECRECGLIFQRDIPGDVLMERLYERWIDVAASREKSERGHDIRYFSRMADEIEMIVTYFGRRPSDVSMLDFGMGWGNWSRMALAHGCGVAGMETSPARKQYVESKGIRCISYEEIASERFDFIHTEQVFEHVPNPSDTVSYLVSSLRRGGLIKISVPNGWGIRRRIDKLDWSFSRNGPFGVMPVQPLEHINCFSENVIVRMATQVGLMQVQFAAEGISPLTRAVRGGKRILKEVCGKFGFGGRCLDIGSTSLYFTHK